MQGNDFLIQESFVLTLFDPDASSFQMQVNITNITNIVLMGVSYMAVDESVSYYFNVFT